MLTREQARTLRFVDSYIREHEGVSPTYREISAHLGLQSASGIFRIISGLEERGFIRRLANRSRAIEVIRMPPAAVEPLPSYEHALATLVAVLRAYPTDKRKDVTDQTVLDIIARAE